MKKSPYEEFHFQVSVIIRRRTVEPSRSPTKRALPGDEQCCEPATKSAVCELRHIDWIILSLPSPLTSGGRFVNLLILVVDDQPDVELLFRQQFRRDLRLGRFTMEFAQSGEAALRRINDAAGVSII